MLNRIMKTEKQFSDELFNYFSGGTELARLRDTLMKHLITLEFEDKELDEIS